jgi:hypothetical protein
MDGKMRLDCILYKTRESSGRSGDAVRGRTALPAIDVRLHRSLFIDALQARQIEGADVTLSSQSVFRD